MLLGGGASGRPGNPGPTSTAVLVTGFDGARSGGLFAFDGSEIVEVDRLSSSLSPAVVEVPQVLPRSRLTPD